MELKREPKTIQKPIKNRFEKKIGKRCFVTLHPGVALEPLSPTLLRRRHPEDTQNQTSYRRKTIFEEKHLILLTRLGRPQARSGYIGPKAFPGQISYPPAAWPQTSSPTQYRHLLFALFFGCHFSKSFHDSDRIMAFISTLFHGLFC